MILIEKSIYYKYSKASVHHIKGCITMVILKSKGYKIEFIFNILWSNILVIKVYIVLSKKLFLIDYNWEIVLVQGI